MIPDSAWPKIINDMVENDFYQPNCIVDAGEHYSKAFDYLERKRKRDIRWGLNLSVHVLESAKNGNSSPDIISRLENDVIEWSKMLRDEK